MRFKNLVFPLLMAAFLLIGGSAMALQSQWPMPPFTINHDSVELVGFMEYITTGDVVNNFFDATVDSFHRIDCVSGTYDVTAIAWEANDDNFFEVNSFAKFASKDSSNFGNWITVNFDTEVATFSDKTYSLTVSAEDTTSNDHLELWVLDQDVTLAYLDNLFLPVGTVIAGFNDAGSDDNHDDMIMAYRSSSVPEPTTMLLLTFCLVGLVGFRRKLKK